MARTPSTMLPLGTPAPAFDLADPDGRRWRLDEFADASALLVIFMCNHCPFVVHVRAELARLATEAQDRGVAVIGINSNDVEAFPEDSPPNMKAHALQYGYTFPYVFDETQAVARAYRAACTPDFFLFDGARELVYRGQLDGSRPGNDVPVTGADLRAAIDAVLAGRPADEPQIPSLGCNIKWRPGHEPDYFG